MFVLFYLVALLFAFLWGWAVLASRVTRTVQKSLRSLDDNQREAMDQNPELSDLYFDFIDDLFLAVNGKTINAMMDRKLEKKQFEEDLKEFLENPEKP